MTEDEAKTKWCPFARCGTPTMPGFAHNRDCTTDETTPSKGAMCIASKCMAWRWMIHDGNTDQTEERNKPAGNGRGYCGLAGHD